MLSTYNVRKLRELLMAFYRVTQLQTTVFDDNYVEVASYPARLPEFCALIRSVPQGRDACLACDRNACRTANTAGHATLYQCHAGLMEAAVPIIQGNITIGYIFFGHLSPEESPQMGWKTVREHCARLPLDMDKLRQAYLETRYFPDDFLLSAAQIMNTVASYLCISHIASLRYDTLPSRIEQYVEGHMSEEITVPVLCEELNVGKTRLAQACSAAFGLSPAECVRQMRLKRAAALLHDNTLPISEIAALVGIPDYNYFTKMFRRAFNMTPRDFRKQLEKENDMV